MGVQRRRASMVRETYGDRSRHLGGAAIAIRTTGPHFGRDELIEVVMQPFLLDDVGRIIETGHVRNWREAPSFALSAGAQRLAGLFDEDLSGRAFPEGEVSSVLLDADFLVAMNSAYCRPFVERRFAAVEGKPWACLLSEVDWHVDGLLHCGTASGVGYRSYDRNAETEVTRILHFLDRERIASAVALAAHWTSLDGTS